MSKYTFEAKLEGSPDYPNAAFVGVPFDVKETFGKSRVKIKATIDGIPYRGTLVKMKTPYHILIVIQEIRKKIGKTHGDIVSIELEEDLEERVVEIPEKLSQIFQQHPETKDFFDSLSYTHRKEYVRWLTSAKRESTRQVRWNKVVNMLLEEVKHP